MLKRFALVFSLAVCMALSMVTPTFAGDLHGTITWQYNRYIGTRADDGAKIWLWPVNYDKRQISEQDEKYWLMGMEAPKNCFVTTVDGYGKFEIYGIPAGEYVIFVSSRNTYRDINEPVESYYRYFSRWFNNMENFRMWCIGTKNFIFKTIKIVDSHPNVYNYDFGYSYL